jgi:hypothetical protein
MRYYPKRGRFSGTYPCLEIGAANGTPREGVVRVEEVGTDMRHRCYQPATVSQPPDSSEQKKPEIQEEKEEEPQWVGNREIYTFD